MNDEQRDQLVKRLSTTLSPTEVGRLKVAYVKLENQLNAFIRSRRLDPLSLPNYKTQRVFADDTSLTIVTDTGHFVRTASERDYDDSVEFSTVECPAIEDAYNMGILSEEQYTSYVKAQQSYFGQRDAESLKARINELVREAGADTIKGYLDELNPRGDKMTARELLKIVDFLKHQCSEDDMASVRINSDGNIYFAVGLQDFECYTIPDFIALTKERR